MSQRQIYILSLLAQNPKGYTANEIWERLQRDEVDVSKRTVYRDIMELSANYGVAEEVRGGKTYYSADKYTLDNVDLTIEDLASLAFAKEMLREYGHLDMGEHAIAFIDKIVKNSASLNQQQFEKLGGCFKRSGQNIGSEDSVNPKTEKAIQNAIDNQNKLSIEYYSFTSNKCEKRTIHPYQMIVIDSYLCVEAYCELRNEVRRFRLSRIQKLEVLDQKFETKADGIGEAFLKLAGGKIEELELLFTGEAIRYVKEYEVKRAKRIIEQTDGLHFYQTTAIAPDVIKWIRGFGPDVKVIKPAWLEEQLLKEARERTKKE